MTLFLMVVALLVYIMLGFFLCMRSKFKGSIFLLSPLILLTGWWVLATNHYFVSSTNLEFESIEEYRLKDVLRKDDIHNNESIDIRQNDDGYFYDLNDLYLNTDNDNRIVSLGTKIVPVETSSGLKEGDTIERAKHIYGDNYYTYREMGLGKAWVYVDRNNDYILTIWSKDDYTVSNIWLSID